jgi:RHS repeat-associated protein
MLATFGPLTGLLPASSNWPATVDKLYYFIDDHLGTPQIVTDDTGAVVWKAAYRPFGVADIAVDKITNNLRFAGQYYDAETGLHYNYHRYYDPSTGRYLTPDPIGLAGGINLYAYAGLNPINAFDPFGLYESSPWLMWVPGQHMWDRSLTAFENGQYGWGTAYLAGMVGEQALFALSFGQYGAAEIGGQCAASKSVAHGPMSPGPLAEDIANTFRSGTYTARTLDESTTLYRVIGDAGNPAGSYWTSLKPQGPLQSVIDSALDQNWGNTATRVIKAKIPAGTQIYEGAAAAQRGLVGGGNQIYIPKVNPKWIVP